MQLIPAIFSQTVLLDHWRVEILVVDDNSPDGTAQALAKKFGRRVRLIVRAHDRGLGTAIGDGVRASKGSVIVGMDADGNHNPIYIPALLATLAHADFVVGSRYISGGGMAQSMQYTISYLANMFIRSACGFPVYDNTSGFYAIYTKHLYAIGISRIYQGYGDYHLRLVWFVKKAGLRIQEIPVYYAPRYYGQSKSRLFIMLFTYVKTVIQLRLKMI